MAGMLEPFSSLRREVDRLFDDFTRPERASWRGEVGAWMRPRVDVVETDKAFELTAELPGVKEQDVKVTLSGDALVIEAEKRAEREEKGRDFRLSERSYGTFRRSLQLPFDVDAGKIDAKFADGVLRVTVPKPPQAEAKPRAQRIEIKH